MSAEGYVVVPWSMPESAPWVAWLGKSVDVMDLTIENGALKLDLLGDHVPFLGRF